MKMRFGHLKARMRANRRGTVTIFVAVWLLVIFGLAAVGIDGGYWYFQRGQQQNAADMAAYAAVAQLASATSEGLVSADGSLAGGATVASTGIPAAAQQVAAANGFSSQNGSNIAVNWPPSAASGPYAGDKDAVEVIVTKPAPLLFASVIRAFSGLQTPTIGARAIARYSSSKTKTCVLSTQDSLTIQGSANVYAPNCALASDSAGAKAVNLNGNPTIVVNTFTTVGQCYNCDPSTSGGSVSVTYDVQPYHLYIPDPFSSLDSAGYTFPKPTGKVQINNSGTYSISPGAYQSIKITNTSPPPNVTFQPGLYVLGTNGMDIEGGNVSCAGCTFVFEGNQSITINGGATVKFSAPTAAPCLGGQCYADLSGVLFYGPGSGSAYQATINGSSGSYFQGAIYFPNADLTLNGTSGFNASMGTSCLMTVAKSITITGSNQTNLDTSDCGSFGLPSAYTRYAQLVQ